jgi:hypothetical protein
MLGRMSPDDHAKKTAEATSKSAELLELIHGDFDDLAELTFD